MSEQQQFGPWKVTETIQGPDRAVYIVEQDGQPKGVLKVSRNDANDHQELNALQAFDHPYVATLIDHNLEADPGYIVTEFVEGGPLRGYEYWEWDDVKLYEFTCRLFEATEYIHSRGFNNLNRTPSNTVVRWDGNTPYPVIIDFETTQPIENFMIRDDMGEMFRDLRDCIKSDRYAQMLKDRYNTHIKVKKEITEEMKYPRRNHNRCCA